MATETTAGVVSPDAMPARLSAVVVDLMPGTAGRRRCTRLIACFVVLGWLGTSACVNRQQILDGQQQALTSLRATVVAVGEAWLAGAVSTAYARTALEATERLLEKQRAALSTPPDLLADPRAASLGEAENRLATAVALLWKAVDAADAGAARRHLSTVASSRATVQ